MKNRTTLIPCFSIIILMLLSVTLGHTNPCAVGTLRYSVLTERQESVSSLAFSPIHNNILAVGQSKITTAADGTIEYDGTIEVWDTSKPKLLHTLRGHTDAVLALAFSPDGKVLASGSADGTVRTWHTDIETPQMFGKHQATFDEHNDLVLTLAFLTESGNAIASGSRDGSIWFWNPKTGQQQSVTPGDAFPSVLSLAFSPDNNLLATGRTDNIIRVWNLTDGNVMYTFAGHNDPVTSLAFSPDGNMLVSGSADSTVRLWDTSTGTAKDKSLHEFTAPTDWVNSVALHGTTLASAGFDSVIHLWNVDTKELLYAITGHIGSIESIAFSPDGKALVSGGHDGKVLLWDLTPPQIEGDVNGDGFVNFVDLERVDEHLGKTSENTADVDGDADINSDDIVNIADLVLVTNAIEATAAERKACASGRTDVNNDRVVDRQDLVAVNSRLGMMGQYREDVNIDGIVNIIDLVLVANAIDIEAASAPSLRNRATALITTEQIQGWLTEAQLSGETSLAYQRGILVLEQLLAMLKSKTTVLLPNYPNPFNPETWLPYRLAAPADVTVTIYAANGTLVKTLQLGHQPAGTYESRARAAYWNGKNEYGEPVASGLYFYSLTAGEFTATRKMLIRK